MNLSMTFYPLRRAVLYPELPVTAEEAAQMERELRMMKEAAR